MIHFRLAFVVCCVCTLLGTSTKAQQASGLLQPIPFPDNPEAISYQGLILQNGLPINDGVHALVVTIYSDSSGLVPIWNDSYSMVTNHGVFDVFLGSGKMPLPSKFPNTIAWMGLKVDGSPEMRPLSRVSRTFSSPNLINPSTLGVSFSSGTGWGPNSDGFVGGNPVSLNFVGGGSGNTAQLSAGSLAGHCTIAGGDSNRATGNISAVVGGFQNTASGATSFIGGGSNNTASGTNGSIAGGSGNSVSSDYSTIGGGTLNQIDAVSDHSSIGGGDLNHIWPNCDHSTITGSGWQNEIGNAVTPISDHDTAVMSWIGGGAYNHIHTKFSTIVGGYNNVINGGTDDELSTIGGGTNNEASEYASVVAGGGSHFADGPWSAISGGTNDTVNNIGQWAVGYYNIPRAPAGIFPFGPGSFPGLMHAQLASVPPVSSSTVLAPDYDNILAMIGNGGGWGNRNARHNAFEISYNGHSTVFDVNGSGGADVTQPTTFRRAVIKGSTYTDNVCYAWGDCQAGGAVTPDFGVATVTHTAGTGVYQFALNIVDPDRVPTNIVGAVTATLVHPDCGMTISVSPITAGNVFTITTSQLSSLPTGGPLNCQARDAEFTFHVFGR